MWNGLTGVSRPGEKVMRFGDQQAAGAQHAPHSATNWPSSSRCSITWKLTTTSTGSSASGNAARLPWRMSTRG